MKLIEKLERFSLPILGSYMFFILLGILLIVGFFFFVEPFSDSQSFFTSGKYQIKVNVESKKLQKGKNRLTLVVNDKNGLPVEAKVRGRFYDKDMKNTVFVDIKSQEKGAYKSVVDIPENGKWILAVDMDSESHGHGDLVFSLETGDKTVQLISATSEGIDYYTCSMHPSVKSTVDGTCPICSMDLIPVMKTGKENAGTVVVDGEKRQRIGVTVETVKKGMFIKTIKAAGKIGYDESQLTDITLRYDAWVETLDVRDVGQFVNKDDSLFNIYSPELISAQQEYLAASRGRGDYKTAAAERLKLWGVSDTQLKVIQKRRRIFFKLPVLSPVAGVVVSKNIIQGTMVKSGTPLLRIADLSKVWLEASIYQSDLLWVKEGVNVEITVDDLPNYQWKSVIKQIDPFVDPQTYTAGVRLEIDNKEGLLRPEMYANADIKVNMGERMLIPESAVIFSGKKRIVFIDLGNGKLKPISIKTGLQNENFIEVVSGLKIDDKVVSSGHFLIAAESKLKSGLQQW